MRNFYKWFAAMIVTVFTISSAIDSNAQDTIHVQAFTFGSSQDSIILFPPDTVGIERIIMNYTLRCPYTVQCGEWDYLTYTYLYKPLGVYDSVSHIAPSYVVNGASPDSFPYLLSPSYTYHPHFEQYIHYTSTISFDSAIVGTQSTTSSHPFNTAMPVCRSQYLWKAAELTGAGLHAGNISNLNFYMSLYSGEMKNLTVRMKASTLDSITTSGYESTGFTTVYKRNTSFNISGWLPLSLTYPFYWDGISNIVIDIGFNNTTAGGATTVMAGNSGFQSGITTASEDRSLFFNGTDYINIPPSSLASLDSFITISFWAKGNPDFLPANVSALEAVDSLDHRVLNIHLPWSDETVYWDAGIDSLNSYDRISKPVTAADYKDAWTYWTFVKNTVTAGGRMKIYKNGVIFLQGVNEHKLMKGIKRMRIGAGADDNNFYKGNLDDVAIFNREVDLPTIQQWMYKKIDASHPFYSNLLFYYNFDNISNTTATDATPNNNDAALFGIPSTDTYHSDSVFKNLENTTVRPYIVFGQGVYNSVIDSILIIDSTANAPVTVVNYRDTLNPTTPSDTLLVWQNYYNNYQYNSNGIAIDSSLVPPDSTLILNNTTYYDPPYEVNDRYELARYITPYGNGLNLGSGFKWKFDVSDYRTLLHDSVHLTAGNWQELLDLSFDMIKGTPPRNVLDVKNVWNAQVWYDSNTETNYLPEKKVYIPTNAFNSRVKVRLTGHGADNNNCSEFCTDNCYLYVDSMQRFSKSIWRNTCSINPLYPQGGTWVYQRANWCPGAEVETYDVELTPYVTPGDTTKLNLNLDPYTTGSGGANYITETQLITYGAPNFTLDAAVYEIKSPNNVQLFQRMNPICNNPLITIKNTGSTTLTSLTITYGMIGSTPATYHWTGTLGFMESEDVRLGIFDWSTTQRIFYATVSSPNGGTDQYSNNNTATSTFNLPPQYDNQLIFELKTNNEPSHNYYDVKDDLGNTILHKAGLAANITYSDTISFNTGCYEFRLHDSGEDGLTWWANTAGGSGTMKIKRASDGAVLVSFNSDFGQEIYQQFTVGYILSTNNLQAINDVVIYPNPSSGKYYFDLMFDKSQDALIQIFDVTGRVVYSQREGNVINRSITIDLSDQPSGIYYVKVQTNTNNWNKRVTLTH